jgi:hypothetical protein
MRYARPASWLGATAMLVAAGACQDATQARVSLQTNVAADADVQVALWVTAGEVDASTPATVRIDTTWGPDGRLGDIVAVPPNSGGRSKVTVRAVLSKGIAPERCLAQDSTACIVSRRTFHYQAQTDVRVPVGLYRQCFGVRCDAGLTCNYEGRCVSEVVDTERCAKETGCLIEGEPPQPPGVESAPVPASSVEGTVAPSLPPPSAISFRDQTPVQGLLSGRLQLLPPSDSANIDGYRLYFADAKGGRLGLAHAWSATGAPLEWTVLADLKAPAGTELFSAVSVRGAEESVAVTTRADNYPREIDQELDTGTDQLYDNIPFLIGGAGGTSTLALVAKNTSNRSTVRLCGPLGEFCKRYDLAPTRGQGIPRAAITARLAGGGLYIVDTTPQGALTLRRCKPDMSNCVATDLSAGTLTPSGLRIATAVDLTRGALFVLTTEQQGAEAATIMLRCPLAGTACARSVLPALPPAENAAVVDPATGDLMVVSNTGAQAKLRLYRCAANGSACVGRDMEAAAPVNERCYLTADTDQSGTKLLVAAQVAGCDLVSPSLGILGATCSLSNDTCTTSSISSAGGEYYPWLYSDRVRDRVLISFSGGGTRAGIHICNNQLADCRARMLASPEIQVEPKVVMSPAGAMYVVSRSTVNRGAVPLLQRCDQNAENCALSELSDTSSKLSNSTNGYSASLAIGSNSVLALASTSFKDQGVLHTCASSGADCKRRMRAPAKENAVAYWPARSAWVVATTELDGAASTTLGVAVCNNIDSTCGAQRAAGARQKNGAFPIVLPDQVGNAFAVVHLAADRPGIEPLLTVCTATGTNCSERDVLAEAGLPPGYYFGVDAKRASVTDDILISAMSKDDVYLLRCKAATTGCTFKNLGPAMDPFDWLTGTSLIPRADGVDVVVGSDGGAEVFRCDNDLACARKEVGISVDRAEDPAWFGSVRDPVHGTVYLATFDSGFRRNDILGEVAIQGHVSVYRCNANFTDCTRVLRRPDIFSNFAYPDRPRPDGGETWSGRPPSLVYDAELQRIVLAVTDAGNLFRPLVLTFGTY